MFQKSLNSKRISSLLLMCVLYTSMLIIAVIKPPFQSPDEFDHYKKSISVAKGQWLQTSSSKGTSGVFLETHYLRFMDAFSHLPFVEHETLDSMWVEGYVVNDTSEIKFTASPGTGPYAPILYLFQGFLHSGLESLINDLFITYKIVVIANLAIFIGVFTKITMSRHVSELPLLFVCSAPLFMFQIGSWSIDSVYFSMTIIMFYFLLIKKNLVYSSILLPIIASTRIAFFVFYLPLLLNTKKSFYHTCLIILGIGATLFWILFAIVTNPNLGNTGVSLNIDNFFKEPVSVTFFLLSEIFNFGRVVGQFKMGIGQLGWLDYSANRWLINWYLIIWFILCLICIYNFVYEKGDQRYLILSGLLMWPAVNIIVGVYTTDFSVTRFGLMGIQGRYFYPSLILFAMYVGYRYKGVIQRYYWPIWALSILTLILSSANTIVTTYQRYY